ncbi:MAG: hypothetical protein F6K03_06835 [Kamptonema sp. SIO4C4]|nr:hypothetical protein [Kamptonema sp. SIO4C4]
MQQSSSDQHPYSDDEISLVDILRFLGRRGQLISLTTLGLTALAVGVSFWQPKPYQKQLTLSIQPTSATLSEYSGLSIPANQNQQQIQALATEFIDQQKSEDLFPSSQTESLTVSASNNTNINVIQLTFESPTPDPLKTATQPILEQLTTYLQTPLKTEVKRASGKIETQLRREQRLLTQIEAELAQAPPVEANKENPRLANLEERRARQQALVTELEFDLQYLEQALADFATFTQQIYLMQIKGESAIEQSEQSLAQVGLLALIASFMVAVLVAIIRDQIPQIRAELAKSEHQNI